MTSILWFEEIGSASSSEEMNERLDYSYTSDWQMIQQWVNGGSTPQYQWVWGLRYVDELICRNDASSTRLYALQDANFNVTSITDTSGSVLERYNYLPYGERTVMDASWTPLGGSAYDWVIGHQGLMIDPETYLIYNRNRMLHAQLGGFLQRDPMGYIDSFNLMSYEKAASITLLDPDGMTCQCHFPAGTITDPNKNPQVPPPSKEGDSAVVIINGTCANDGVGGLIPGCLGQCYKIYIWEGHIFGPPMGPRWRLNPAIWELTHADAMSI